MLNPRPMGEVVPSLRGTGGVGPHAACVFAGDYGILMLGELEILPHSEIRPEPERIP